MMKKLLFFFIFLMATGSAFANVAIETEDMYLEGFIRGMLREKYSLNAELHVRNREVFIRDNIATNQNYEQIIEDISKIEHVRAIKLVDSYQIRRIGTTWTISDDTLFRPLAADPRWPRFSAAYHYHTNGTYFKHAFDAAIGKTFPLYKGGLGTPVLYEAGVQAAVFPTFNLDTSDLELINTDYLFGIPVTFGFEGIYVMVRIYHQASHMGHAYFVRNKDVERVDLSYQAIDMLASIEPNDWFRLYGGGGVVIHSNPGNYGTFMYQGGVEARIKSEVQTLPDMIFALDVKGQEENNYIPSYSISLGAELNRRTKIALELYDGYIPNGQFYKERVTWIGLGLHLY